MSYTHDWDDVFEVGQILKKALSRCEQGQKCYGVFRPDEDTRDLLQEAEEELLDTVVYACFQILKLRRVREKLARYSSSSPL